MATNECEKYVCIRCGHVETEGRRFFQLDELLKLFYPEGLGKSAFEYLDGVAPGFRVGAMFGEDVWGIHPQVSNGRTYKEMNIKLSALGLFSTIEKQLGLDEGILKQIAEVKRTEKYENINNMLSELRASADTLGGKKKRVYNAYFGLEGRVSAALSTEALTNANERSAAVYSLLDALCTISEKDSSLKFEESKGSGEYEYVNNEKTGRVVKAAWVYSAANNGVEFPDRLEISDIVNGKMHVCKCARSCCPNCRKPLSKWFGVYPQVTVGVLGSQSTGKTTYLAALTDFFQNDIKMNEMPFTVTCGDENDPQWIQFTKGSDKAGGENPMDMAAGALWAYQNGYKATKTAVAKGAASLLTFLVKPENSMPTLYVLVDIAGEFFKARTEQCIDDDTVSERAIGQQALLKNCDALFMILSCDKNDRTTNAGQFAQWMESFRQNGVANSTPRALMLTKADKMFEKSDNKTERALKKALALKRNTPSIIANQLKKVYNVEAMNAYSRLAADCANRMVPGIMGQLYRLDDSEGTVKMSVFPICSGTGNYTEIKDTEEEAEREKRYQEAICDRYGIADSFCWLMAARGQISVGRGESNLLNYGEDATKQLEEVLIKQLYYDPND